MIPFGLAGVLFAGILLVLVRHGLHVDNATFVYPLDDAYIHLAVSRNLALHGVWGISANIFSGASSSPAWTLLLAAAARAVGVHLLTPFVLNVAAGLLLLLFASCLLARTLPGAGIPYLASALCFLVLIAPLPGIALIGMEHLFHALAILLLATAASRILSLPRDSPVQRSIAGILLFSALIGGALRYESCFAIGVIITLLVVRRRVLLALSVAFFAALGPLVYALYSRAHSGVLLPFSVIMKSSIPTEHHGLNALAASDISPILILLVVVLLLRMAQRAIEPDAVRWQFWNFTNVFLFIAIAITVLHAEIGPSGWLMRYEAYLYVLGVIALAIALPDVLEKIRERTRSRGWIIAAWAVALLPVSADLLHRIHHGYSDFAASLHDRYVEHLPQALFVHSEMPAAVVLANDIGFLAYYAPDAVILDPLGLGSIEPVQLARKHQAINPDFVAQWAAHDHANLAILHTDFPGMDNLIPLRWILVESWCFPHNLVFGNHIESFYAPDPASAASLRARLAAFADTSSEIVRYRFLRSGAVPPMPTQGETAACPIPQTP